MRPLAGRLFLCILRAIKSPCLKLFNRSANILSSINELLFYYSSYNFFAALCFLMPTTAPIATITAKAVIPDIIQGVTFTGLEVSD